MVDEKDFQRRMQRIDELVHDLETIADPAARAGAKELVQLLMDLHGAGLERILEIVFQAGGAGAPVVDELGRDPLVSSLLILYGLHPEELQVRVGRKLEQIGSKLHQMGAEARLVAADSGDVRVRISVDRHTCGSTARTVLSTVEEAIYEAAPDLRSLVVEGLEEPAASGFVALEKLIGAQPGALLPTAASPEPVPASDGMD